MIKKENIFGIAILLILILNFGFILSQEIEVGEYISYDSEKVDYKFISEDGKDVFQLDFTRGGSAQIKGKVFKNILPASESLNPSYIKIDDTLGNILEADLTADSIGGYYSINGVSVHLDPGERVYYNGKQNKYYLSKGASIGDSSVDLAAQPEKAFTVKTESAVSVLGMIINGEADITKDGTLLKSGSAVFSNQELIIDKSPVLIASEGFDVSNYAGNWVQQSVNKLEMKSSATGNFKVKFLENNALLNNQKYSKLDISVKNGDGLKIEKFKDAKIPVITHKSSKYGSAKIENGALISYFDQSNYFVENKISVDDILSKRYLGVPSLILSDSSYLRDQIYVDNLGRAFVGKKLPFNYHSKYENEDLSLLFEKTSPEDLQKIAKSIKDNVKKNPDVVLSERVPIFLRDFSQNLDKEQAAPFVVKIIEASGDYSSQVLEDMYSSNLVTYFGARPNKNYAEFNDFMAKTIESAKETNNMESFISSIYSFEKVISEGADLSLTSDFIDKIYNSEEFKKSDYGDKSTFLNDFSFALKEYNGKNFDEISRGVKIIKKYDFSKELDLKYSDIKDKKSLAENYALAINNYVIKKPESEQNLFSIADSINSIHEHEFELDGKDSIRESIIKDLNFESKYNLISRAGESLYISTFEKMYNSFPEDFLEQIKKVDPKNEFLSEFSLELASKGKLAEVSEKDPRFFVDSIKKGLDEKNKDIDKLIRNGDYLTETINEYYKNPNYQNEKKELENFLVEKYSKTKEPEQKRVYAYFLKLDKNPITQKAEELSKTLQEIPPIQPVPERYSDKKILNAKVYFDKDAQGWFKETQKEYKEKYKMSVIKETGKEAILSKKFPSGKEIRINLEFAPEDVPLENAKDVFKSDKYQLIAHRGHYYSFDKFFTEPSKADKIIYLGGCGSFSKCLPDVQRLYPHSQIISDVDVGTGAVNNKAIYELLEDISNGEREWDKIKPAYAEKENLVYPDNQAYRLRQYVYSK